MLIIVIKSLITKMTINIHLNIPVINKLLSVQLIGRNRAPKEHAIKVHDAHILPTTDILRAIMVIYPLQTLHETLRLGLGHARFKRW